MLGKVQFQKWEALSMIQMCWQKNKSYGDKIECAVEEEWMEQVFRVIKNE